MIQQFLLVDDSTFFLLLDSEPVVPELPPLIGHPVGYSEASRKRQAEAAQYVSEINKLRSDIRRAFSGVKSLLKSITDSDKAAPFLGKQQLERLRDLLSSTIPEPREEIPVADTYRPMLKDLLDAKRDLTRKIHGLRGMMLLISADE